MGVGEEGNEPTLPTTKTTAIHTGRQSNHNGHAAPTATASPTVTVQDPLAVPLSWLIEM
jgi:hypothetical protein